MNRLLKFITLILIVFSFISHVVATPIISDGKRMLIGKETEILNDSLNKYSAQEALQSPLFYKSTHLEFVEL